MTNSTSITAAPGLPFIDVVREFDAPVQAVFRAHVQPDLFARWSGPRGLRMEQVELDPTAGGKWRYAFRAAGDQPFSFFGVFHAVERDALIVQTFEFNLAPGQVGLSTTTFTDLQGRARLALHEVYPSVAARDAALASGMEHGIVEGYERLDELLA